MLAKFYPSRRCVDGTLEGHLEGGIPATLPAAELLANDLTSLLAQTSLPSGPMYVSVVQEGRQAIVSRRVPALLKDLFTDRYAVIARREIDIYAVVREPCVRAKVAVDSERIGPIELVDDGVALQQIVIDSGDPIIDVIATDPEPAMYVCNALAPSNILRIGSDAHSHELGLVIADHEPLDLIHFQLASDLVGWSLTVRRQAAFEQNGWTQRQ